jgi:hypothetical protein
MQQMDVADSSRVGYGSKKAAFQMKIMTMMMITKIAVESGNL